MADCYIPRTLIRDRAQHDEKLIAESDIPSITAPIVILGDPGLGKTQLTKTLEERFGFKRVTGGTFCRMQNYARLQTAPDSRLIIDGLDEITSSSGVSAIDEVLKKLSELGNPNFILSCRSADWQGSTDRYKINEDYGIQPVTLQLQPFTYEDATAFLKSYDEEISAHKVLDQLDRQDLGEFYVNPLTLTLIAEILTAGQGVPKGRGGLFESASKLLTSERNPIHQRSKTAQSNLETLLASAGAIFSHLLLSGSLGVTDRAWDTIPDGYVHLSDLTDMPDAPAIREVLKTRLFQSLDENLYAPFHRVIAEFLGARWLSTCLSNGLSERRAFQALTFNGGVPTAFRGLHAWLAHFCPRLAPRCIKADPYGVLRYGEPDRLPIDQARLLLKSLASLAEEDPYFRSEDWGRRAISGLARIELKDEVLAIITEPERHVHLSMLVLEALQNSSLTKTIVRELQSIIEEPEAAYAERSSAAEALVQSGADVDWPSLAGTLQERSAAGDKRLTLAIIALVGGAGFIAQQIAQAILAYERRGDEDDEEASNDPHVSGMTYGIAKAISPQLSGAILDQMSDRLKLKNSRVGYELTSAINELVETAIQDNDIPSPERVWSWLKLTENETGYSSDRKQPVSEWLMRNPALRHQIQRRVIEAATGNEGPWIAVVHDLPLANRALAVSAADAAEMLLEIGLKDNLSDRDIVLWTDLMRSQQSSERFPTEVRSAAALGIGRHSILSQRWDEITAPPKRNWKKEEEERRTRRDEERERRFADHRASYLPHIKEIAAGEDINCLVQIARAYLGMYFDLDRANSPEERVRIWLGKDLADAALTGFVTALTRKDMPTAREIAETHVEGKYRNVELVLVCGINELVRSGRSLLTVAPGIAGAALAAWWNTAAFDPKQVGENIRDQLEAAVFSSESAVEEFLHTVVEPHIRAGHQYIPGLHRLSHESRFSSLVGTLSVRWLTNYATANSNVQASLLRMAIEHGRRNDLRALALTRLSEFENFETPVRRLWLCASFIVDFDSSKELCAEYFRNDKNCLWTLEELIERERNNAHVSSGVTVDQRELIIRVFGSAWPIVARPTSTMGSTHPWDASDFIRTNIRAIGSEPTETASTSLNRLASLDATFSYFDDIKHARAQQLRLRRDTEFRIPSFEQIKGMLSGRLPANIDDLKAMLLDRLEVVQDYIRNGDTNAWEAFWIGDTPKSENTCRDRLLDQLRLGIPVEINFLPEITMPDVTRADIVAIYLGYGLPVEIKGQWHPKVWNAASVQLIEQYARDWRADDRGIYLVLWFGNVPGKNLPGQPQGLLRPSSGNELREMLIAGLAPSERTRIDVFVLDVSKPRK
jgi:hypothetical protein